MEQRFLNHVSSGLVRAFNTFFVFTATVQTASAHLMFLLPRHAAKQMEEDLVPSLLPGNIENASKTGQFWAWSVMDFKNKKILYKCLCITLTALDKAIISGARVCTSWDLSKWMDQQNN